MKTKTLSVIAMVLVLFMGMTSCKEDNKAPKINSAVLSSDNKTIAVTFSEAVYAKADATGELTADHLAVTAPGLDFTYTVSHTAGAAVATVNLAVTSVIQGTEKFTVAPVAAKPIYDNEGLAMEASAKAETGNTAQDLGIMGNWVSEGDNVAPLLVTYFNVAKVTANFKTDMTYIVGQYNIGNATTTPDLVFSGTYEIEKSTVGEIWTVKINQDLPFLGEAAGIFEVKKNPEVLWYEVVQTSGTQNVPPTAAAGFGSSNGGTLGTINIQKFVRVN